MPSVAATVPLGLCPRTRYYAFTEGLVDTVRQTQSPFVLRREWRLRFAVGVRPQLRSSRLAESPELA
jgi:hypothetical protein